jgi:hypothetical protein
MHNAAVSSKIHTCVPAVTPYIIHYISLLIIQMYPQSVQSRTTRMWLVAASIGLAVTLVARPETGAQSPESCGKGSSSGGFSDVQVNVQRVMAINRPCRTMQVTTPRCEDCVPIASMAHFHTPSHCIAATGRQTQARKTIEGRHLLTSVVQAH